MGNLYFIIALEYTHTYLKTANLIGFRCIYEIVFVKSNKKRYHLNLNGILLTKFKRVLSEALKIKR